jgi:hypothetical protein
VSEQGLASLTNFGLAIVVARSVSVTEFGAFSLAFAIFLVALTVTRGLAAYPLTITYSGEPNEAWRLATARASGAALVAGLVVGATLGVLGLGMASEIGASLAITGMGLPGLLVQDSLRHAFFASGRGRDAFVNMLVLTLVLAASIGIVHALAWQSLAGLMWAWAAAGSIAALVGCLQLGRRPRPAAVGQWWSEHRTVAPRLATEGLLLSGAQYASLQAVTIVIGLAATGAIRAGQVLLNLVNIPMFGVQTFGVPEAIRLRRRAPATVLRFCGVVSVGLGALALAWGIVVMALPDVVGREILGDSWPQARRLIPPLTLLTIATGLEAGAVIGLRAFSLTRESLRARATTSSLVIGAAAIGAMVAGAEGAAWGMAGTMFAATLRWWTELLRGSRQSAGGGV